ncbi:hypothetical protein FRC16_006696 [Serendipita sp. 398]|nr:hypothetical protein FRC16_006696 [Serendipita sp. 398]
MEIEHWCPICDRQILPTANLASNVEEDSPLDSPKASSPVGEEPQTPTTPITQNQTKNTSSRPRQSSPATTRKKATNSTGGTKGSRPGLHRSKTTQGNIHHKKKSAINLGDINLIQEYVMPPVPDDYQEDREVGTATGAKTSRIGTISREEPNTDAGAPAGVADDGDVVVLRRTRRDRLHSLGRHMKAMPLPALGPDAVIDENMVAPPALRPKTSGKPKTGTKLRPKPLILTSAESATLTNDKASTTGSNQIITGEANEIITPASPVRSPPVPEYLQARFFCSQECYNVALGVDSPKVQQHSDANEEKADHVALSFRRAPGSILSSSTPLIAALLSDTEYPVFRHGLRPREKRNRPKIKLQTNDAIERDSKEKLSRRRSGRGEARRHSVAVLDGYPVASIDRPKWMMDEEEDWESYCLARKADTYCTYDQWKALRHEARVKRLLNDPKGLTPIKPAASGKETIRNGDLIDDTKTSSVLCSSKQPTTKPSADSIRRGGRVLPPLLIKTHICVATSPTTPSNPMLSPTKVEGLSYYAPSSSPEPITAVTGSGSSGEESSGTQASPRKNLPRGNDRTARHTLLQSLPQTPKPSESTLDHVDRVETAETGSPVVSFLGANQAFPRMISTLLPRF